MTRLPDESPEALNAADDQHEVIPHPTVGQVSAWVDKALFALPSAGTIGRMELLRHWDEMSTEKRQMLLLLARQMCAGEQG